LKYGLIYAFFRTHLEQLGIENSPTPLLSATEIRLRALAPVAFYKNFEKKYDWLKKLEKRFNEGLQDFSANQMENYNLKLTGFQFDVFPKNFNWDHTKHTDENHRGEVKAAVNGRHPL